MSQGFEKETDFSSEKPGNTQLSEEEQWLKFVKKRSTFRQKQANFQQEQHKRKEDLEKIGEIKEELDWAKKDLHRHRQTLRQIDELTFDGQN